ncbi:MAG: hypothetical protein J0H71_15145 [Rhizobiales bacterium]|nr:hypothetical protein [Hyphomicrobiales bacterium]
MTAGRLAVLIVTALITLAPNFIDSPTPEKAIVLDEAQLSFNGGAMEAVRLPHTWRQDQSYGAARATYSIRLPASAMTPSKMLVIPAVRQPLVARLNGERLDGNGTRPWSRLATGAAYFLTLPGNSPSTADGRLEITLERRDGAVPGHLSPIYIADQDAIDGNWLWTLGGESIWITVFVIQILVTVGITMVWMARRHDRVFGWLFLIAFGSLIRTLPGLPGEAPTLVDVQLYFMFLMSGLGLTGIGLALAIIGSPRPIWLKITIVAAPLVLAAGVASGILPTLPAILLSALIATGGNIVAALVLLRGSLRQACWERLLLAVPFFLMGWFGLRDLGVVVGAIDGVFLLTDYVRAITITAIFAMLMWRLATSLNALDQANDVLRQKLMEQQAELTQLHGRETARASNVAREEERQRLMRDLHDGLSGHLVSIIALSEKEAADRTAIERTAREALDDLRMVINSLDLGDGDLLFALAEFRERIGPQLRRMGITFEWSVENLPQISGMTPGNALSILRILQEAVTNAIKHGPARSIQIINSGGENGAAVITVRNDSAGMREGINGRGLNNMQRRARALGGRIHLDHSDRHTVLTLVLPACLAEG